MLPAFPEPTKIIKDDRQFNAVTLGPGNTFSVHEPPADYELDAFDFGNEEKTIWLEWRSGRLETTNLDNGKRIAESKPFKTPVFEALFDKSRNQIVLVTQAGVIRFIDPRSGKALREIQAEKGKFNYDIQKVLLSPDGSWLAYVNQDNGKVLDIRSDPPRTLADLEDGYDLALSPDRMSLWVVDRKKLFGLSVSDWKSLGSTELLDQVKLDNTTTLALVSDHGRAVAFIPSKSGLLRYELPSMTGRKVTDIPTYWVGADPSHNQVFVHEFKVSAVYDADASVRCRWQIRPAQDFKVSPSGLWLADRNFGKVELWSTEAITHSGCPAPPQ